jgi:hypothetical protein
MTIHKYTLDVAPRVSIPMPLGARILSVQVQENELRVWALVDPSQKLCTQIFQVCRTGGPVDTHPGYRFIDTVQLNWAVWHIFHREGNYV